MGEAGRAAAMQQQGGQQQPESKIRVVVRKRPINKKVRAALIRAAAGPCWSVMLCQYQQLWKRRAGCELQCYQPDHSQPFWTRLPALQQKNYTQSIFLVITLPERPCRTPLAAACIFRREVLQHCFQNTAGATAVLHHSLLAGAGA